MESFSKQDDNTPGVGKRPRRGRPPRRPSLDPALFGPDGNLREETAIPSVGDGRALSPGRVESYDATTEMMRNRQIELENPSIKFPSPDPLLENQLNVQLEPETHIKSVSKELFSVGDIDLKTEVTHNEINAITKLRFLQNKFGVANINNLIDSLLSLRVSKARKSRREFIDSLQAERRNEQGGNFLSKIFGGGGGGNMGP